MATDFRLKEQLPELADRLVVTYSELGTISHLGHCPLPNYESIIAATEALKEVLYPGYRRRDGLHLGNVTYYVGDLIEHPSRQTYGANREGVVPRIAESFGLCATPNEREDYEAMGQAPRSPFSSNCPSCGGCWQPTLRRPTLATRPASRSTK